MAATHTLALVAISVTLSATPAGRASFGTVAYFVDMATNTLNSQRTMTVASYAEAEAAEADGYISSTTLAALLVAFSQNPKPAKVRLVRVNTAASETYPQALTALLALTDDFYGIVCDTRTDTIQVAMSVAVEAMTKNALFFFQSNDADWLTSGVPSAYSTIVNNDRTIPLYHDDDTDRLDLGYPCKMLAWSPDERAAGWAPQIVLGVPVNAPITDTQRDFIYANNCNVGLEFGPELFQVAQGVTMTGRDIGEQYAADVLYQRLLEDVSAQWSAVTNAGGKWSINAGTQAFISAIILARVQALAAVGHFAVGQVAITAETITQDDIDARRLRFTVAVQYNQALIYLPIAIGLSTGAVVEE